jgi:hypothetical protein
MAIIQSQMDNVGSLGRQWGLFLVCGMVAWSQQIEWLFFFVF